MGILLLLLTLSANCLLALKFVDRNNTHQLFEYTFPETECENGLFHVHEFESGVSFGSLTTGQAIRCIGRSGYRSVPLTTSFSFESNGTVAPLIDRLVETKEFSIECWVKVEEQSFVLSQLLSVAEITSTVYDNHDLFSIQQYTDSIHFVLQTGTSPTSLNMYTVEEPYVHLVVTARMRQSGTDLAVILSLFSYPDLRERNASAESDCCLHLLRPLGEDLSPVRIARTQWRTLYPSLERRSLLHWMVRSCPSHLPDSAQLCLLCPTLASLARAPIRPRIPQHALPHPPSCARLQPEFANQPPSRLHRHRSSPVAAPHRTALFPHKRPDLLSPYGGTGPH